MIQCVTEWNPINVIGSTFSNKRCKGENGENYKLVAPRSYDPDTFIEHRLEKAMECYYNGKQFSIVKDITESGVIVEGMYQAVRLNGP